MFDYFDPSNYFSAVTRNQSVDSLKSLVRLDPKFQYEFANYDDFCKKYTAEGWLARKGTAVPVALWSATARPLYRLLKFSYCLASNTLIKCGVPVPASSLKGRVSIYAECYSLARDFQESFGRITQLFHDRYGQYLIQDSQFHRSCYECFSASVSKERLDVLRQDAQLDDAGKILLAGEYFKLGLNDDGENVLGSSFDKAASDNLRVRSARFFLNEENFQNVRYHLKKIDLDVENRKKLSLQLAKGFVKVGNFASALHAVGDLDASEQLPFLMGRICELATSDQWDEAFELVADFPSENRWERGCLWACLSVVAFQVEEHSRCQQAIVAALRESYYYSIAEAQKGREDSNSRAYSLETLKSVEEKKEIDEFLNKQAEILRLKMSGTVFSGIAWKFSPEAFRRQQIKDTLDLLLDTVCQGEFRNQYLGVVKTVLDQAAQNGSD